MRSLRDLLDMWTDPRMKETIRSLWTNKINIPAIVNIEIENNTTNIYQSISKIIRTNQDNNHQSFLIENTANAFETVESTWSVITYNEQVGEFKAVVMVRNKATNTIITLMSLLSFDYSDAVDVVLQTDLITDAALTLTLGVNGLNMLYATITGMPADAKRIHLCFERCVMSERAVLLEAEFQFDLNMEADLSKYKLIGEADSEFSLGMEAALSAYVNISADFALSLGMTAELTKVEEAPPALMHFNSLYPVGGDTHNRTGTFVSDPYSLSQWNDFFDLPANGPEFTSISVVGNTVDLIGPGGINLRDMIFYIDTEAHPSWTTKLARLDDRLGMFVSAGADCFGYATIGDVNLPALTTAGDFCFEFGLAGTFNAPLLTTLGNACFYQCLALNYRLDSLTTLTTANYGLGYAYEALSFYLPALTTIDADTFPNYTNQASLTITIPVALMTSNGGNPHPEVQKCIDYCPVPLTIITV